MILIIWYFSIYTSSCFPVCQSGQYISLTTLFDFVSTSENLTEIINSYFWEILLEKLLHYHWLSVFAIVPMKIISFHWMALRQLERKADGAKRPLSV